MAYCDHVVENFAPKFEVVTEAASKKDKPTLNRKKLGHDGYVNET